MRRIGWYGFALILCCLASAAGAAADEEGLVGYWRFDKSDHLLHDLSRNGLCVGVSGGKVVQEDGRDVLALDGRQRIAVGPSAKLNLAPGFSIEARVRLDQLAHRGQQVQG